MTDFGILIGNSYVDPITYAEAIKSPKWRQAMLDELAALEANNTWHVVSVSLSKNAVGCKLVF